MNEREAFKFGFLLKCADDGLNEAQALVRARVALVKQGQPAAAPAAARAAGLGLGTKTIFGAGAAGILASAAKGGLQVFLNALKFLRDTYLHYGLPLAAGTGLVGGWALSQAMDDAYDKVEAMNEEEIDTLYNAMENMRRAREQRELLEEQNA